MPAQILLPALGCPSIDMISASEGFDWEAAWAEDLGGAPAFDQYVLVGTLFKIVELCCRQEHPFK